MSEWELGVVGSEWEGGSERQREREREREKTERENTQQFSLYLWEMPSGCVDCPTVLWEPQVCGLVAVLSLQNASLPPTPLQLRLH